MRDTFKTFFDRALEHEGRVCEDVPGDRGGPTKWGVTIGRLATRKGVREPARGTAAFERLKGELFALSAEEIEAIYREDYWDAVRGDDLPAGLDYACADYGLNSGPSRAVKCLQRLVGNPQTGRMDDETIAEACAANARDLVIDYCVARQKFLNAIVDGNPSQRKFLNGWTRRVHEVQTASVRLTEAAPAPQVNMAKAVAPDQPIAVTVADLKKQGSGSASAIDRLLAMLGLPAIGGASFGASEFFGLFKESTNALKGMAIDHAGALVGVGLGFVGGLFLVGLYARYRLVLAAREGRYVPRGTASEDA